MKINVRGRITVLTGLYDILHTNDGETKDEMIAEGESKNKQREKQYRITSTTEEYGDTFFGAHSRMDDKQRTLTYKRQT